MTQVIKRKILNHYILNVMISSLRTCVHTCTYEVQQAAQAIYLLNVKNTNIMIQHEISFNTIKEINVSTCISFPQVVSFAMPYAQNSFNKKSSIQHSFLNKC